MKYNPKNPLWQVVRLLYWAYVYTLGYLLWRLRWYLLPKVFRWIVNSGTVGSDGFFFSKRYKAWFKYSLEKDL